ncbi:MAG TPA: arsenate reductase family protein [Polyangiaceae bacterium]|nr:arsenate reductase family protein [Polyangiaceae bacterium]
MAVRVFQYAKCGTCRKALALLDALGVEYETVDIVTAPPSREQLAKVLDESGLPIAKLFNTSGQSYRDGGYKERLPKLSHDQALRELAADGKLIKRPIVIGNGFALVGFDEASYRRRFG